MSTRFDAELFPEHEALANQRLHEAVEIPVSLEERPVEPADLVVLAVGIVVALLRPPDLVAQCRDGPRATIPHLA